MFRHCGIFYFHFVPYFADHFIRFNLQTTYRFTVRIAVLEYRLIIICCTETPLFTYYSIFKTGIDLSCNFENGLCHWRQDNITDDFDWQITHLRSPDPTSGPEGDHTIGSKIFFFFFTIVVVS